MPVPDSLDLAIQDAWPLLLLPVAFGLAYLGYRSTSPPQTGGRRAVLVTLRTVAYGLLLLVLAGPVLNRVRGEPMRARIAVLMDESASMSTVDAPGGRGGPERLQRAQEVLRTLQDELRGSDVDLEVVPFATAVLPPLAPRAYLESSRQATGAGTDPLGALRATVDRLAGQNLQAAVLLSDGRPTRGALDPSGPSGLGRPVFAVGFGDTLTRPDLGIERCDYNQVAYLESETPIEVRVENSGFRGRSTSLRLLQGARELCQRRLTFEQEHGRTTVQIPVKLETPGHQRFRLLLDPLPEEATDRNNSREISIEVLKNRIRVLVLAARPDWDVGFLARQLGEDPNVRLTLAYLNAEGAWVKSEDSSPFSLPRGAKAVEDYDLYVVAAPGPEPQPGLWKDIVAAVERGKGLLVLSGRESAMTKGDAFAALEAALPVQRQRSRALQYQPVEARLTPQGRHHPATASLAELAGPRGEIEALPPLLGLHVDASAKPGALVLLATDQQTPVVVVGRYGQGQTAVCTGFPLWRWRFTDREPLRQATTRFVANLIRWLTQPRDVRQVQIASAKTVYEGGENAEFFVHVLDAQYVPLDDAEVRVEVQALDGKGGAPGTLLLPRRAGRAGEYAGVLSGLGPGEYEARVVAARQGAPVGRDAVRFTVDAYSVEYANLSQDVDFLRELAERTGGRYAAPEQAMELARALPRAPERVLLQSEIEIWNTAPLFVLFVAVLGAEWLLRKRYGLL